MKEERIEADVAIVGAGIAGMVAGVTAAQAGLSVIVLERSAEVEYRCSSRLTGGVFHCALRSPDTPAAELEAAIVSPRGQGGNKALAAAVARDALPSIRWLQQQGARFIKATPDPWQRFVLSPPSLGRPGEGWRKRGGDTLLRLLAERLEIAGGQLRRDSRVTSLLQDEDGVIAGVRGDDFIVGARAVVLADGGFQQDPDLVALGISPQPQRIVQRNGGTGWGDSLRMAQAVGGQIEDDRTGFYGHVVSRDAFTNDDLRFYPWLDELARNGMAVTPDGKRFCDESKGGIHLANRIAALPDPASATVIWDDAIWRRPGRARFMPPNPSLDDRGATIHRASTLEELARKAGIDPAGLVSEVQMHNDALTARELASLIPARSSGGGAPMPISTPPFAAAPAAAGMTYTMSGISVDANSRVVATDGSTFSNLFAVGGASGGIEGGQRPIYVGGLIKATTTGWRAGQTIAAILTMPTGTTANIDVG